MTSPVSEGGDWQGRVSISAQRRRASMREPTLRALRSSADAVRGRRAAVREFDTVGHLYVHLPFCAHRCGYCDFVTVVGKEELHDAYVAALLHELELEGEALASRLESVYLGGGTPTFTAGTALAKLLRALPRADELTVEANPETVTSEMAAVLRAAGVTRVSLGAQSFRPDLLRVLERRASPEVVRRAVYLLRDAGFDNISLDLVYGIPGQSPADLGRDLDEALALELQLSQKRVDVIAMRAAPADDRDEIAVTAPVCAEGQMHVQVADGSVHFRSRLSTARKASWGTSTPPTCFIRFLPFFCFSSSLRFREMSPP